MVPGSQVSQRFDSWCRIRLKERALPQRAQRRRKGKKILRCQASEGGQEPGHGHEEDVPHPEADEEPRGDPRRDEGRGEEQGREALAAHRPGMAALEHVHGPQCHDGNQEPAQEKK